MKIFSATILILVCTCAGFGQREKSIQVNNPPCFIDNKFVLNSNTLPKNFHGFDLSTVFEELDKRQTTLTKDEFETTAQFEQRKADARNKPLTGNIALNNKFFFELSPDFHYDADTEIVSTFLNFFDSTNWENPCEKQSKPYNLYLSLPGQKEVDSNRISVAVKLPLSIARQTKPNLRLLVTGQLNDNPIKEVASYPDKAVNLNVTSVIIYNLTSGEILKETKF